MALGVQEGLSSIFTYIPYPMLYGAIFDSACLVWEDKCGKPGVCWLYDTDRLRYSYHGLSVAILLTAVVFELGLVYHSGRMSDFYSDAAGTASQRREDTLIVADDPEGSSLVDEQKTRCEDPHIVCGEKEDEGLLDDVDHQAPCGFCKRESKSQAPTC